MLRNASGCSQAAGVCSDKSFCCLPGHLRRKVWNARLRCRQRRCRSPSPSRFGKSRRRWSLCTCSRREGDPGQAKLDSSGPAGRSHVRAMPCETRGVAKRNGMFVATSAQAYAEVKRLPNAPRTIAKRIVPPRVPPTPDWLWTAVRTSEAESLRKVPEIRLHSYRTNAELLKQFKTVVAQHKNGSDAFVAAVIQDRPDLAGVAVSEGRTVRWLTPEQDRLAWPGVAHAPLATRSHREEDRPSKRFDRNRFRRGREAECSDLQGFFPISCLMRIARSDLRASRTPLHSCRRSCKSSVQKRGFIAWSSFDGCRSTRRVMTPRSPRWFVWPFSTRPPTSGRPRSRRKPRTRAGREIRQSSLEGFRHRFAARRRARGRRSGRTEVQEAFAAGRRLPRRTGPRGPVRSRGKRRHGEGGPGNGEDQSPSQLHALPRSRDLERIAKRRRNILRKRRGAASERAVSPLEPSLLRKLRHERGSGPGERDVPPPGLLAHANGREPRQMAGPAALRLRDPHAHADFRGGGGAAGQDVRANIPSGAITGPPFPSSTRLTSTYLGTKASDWRDEIAQRAEEEVDGMR